MNILIVTQNSPMYLAAFLDDFFDRLKETKHRVGAIVVFSPFFKPSVFTEVKERYRYYGFKDFLEMTCRIFGNAVLSRLYYLFPSVGCHSIRNVIKKYSLRSYAVDSLNSRKFIEQVEKDGIDLIVSIASPKIFGREVLHVPKNGCINYHTALLPKYRGRQPLFWAMLNDEKEIGISIHEMDERIDNGPIILQQRIPVGPGDTLHSLYVRTLRYGPRLLLEAISRIADGAPQRLENDERFASYYGFPTRKDAALFRTKGKKFF